MADKYMSGDSGSRGQGSADSAPNPDNLKPSTTESMAANQSTPHRGRSDRGAGNSQRGHGRSREKGNNRGHGGKHVGRERQEKGRSEWSRNPVDKRKRDAEDQAIKRQRIGQEVGSSISALFTAEEIAAEERKPKRKVAVLIGYAGSGYKGMQINGSEKTIEGDLFSAFVAAGAISKANANDPKKSSLVRCARTDKGVHAAGNVISLKLIVEDSDVVQKINGALPPQIRVWGLERTNGSFSCYQACDSRWYEYLIPTYSFLPPHPRSFLGKKLVESAAEEGTFEHYKARQADVATFWEDAEKEYVNTILDRLDPETRNAVMEAVHKDIKNTANGVSSRVTEEDLSPEAKGNSTMSIAEVPKTPDKTTVDPAIESPEAASVIFILSHDLEGKETEPKQALLTPVEAAIKEVKAAYIQAKKAYRISPIRQRRVQDALSAYVGTHNFHNYTIQKSFREASANRFIRSFKAAPDPILINDTTEWLSLKVHGQSFMMHQIRKMVAMVALVIRCGAPLARIPETYSHTKISIPKAPGLGLLLERPVFETYNEKAVRDFQREKIDFAKFESEMEAFKQKEIYERIFREEERDHQFHVFFHHLDNFRTNAFLWVTAPGLRAVGKGEMDSQAAVLVGSDSEDEVDGHGGDEEG